MSAPRSGTRPFPVPVVALGPGSQSEEDVLDYLVMPQGMDTYQPPRLPEPEALHGHAPVLTVLERILGALDQVVAGAVPAVIPLLALTPADRALCNQLLGEGEVSAQVQAQPGLGGLQVQESVFAGVWRVLTFAADGRLEADVVEVGACPAALVAIARAEAIAPAVSAAPPPGVMNAPAILAELADARARHSPGQPAHVVNLTLLPLSPADIAWMDQQLGTGRVVVLSRGYGNCRITSTRTADTWRVVYYNSQDAVILDSIEVVDIPEVACAAVEDLRDSRTRIAEVMDWVRQGM